MPGGATLLRSILVICNAVCVIINWIIEIDMLKFLLNIGLGGNRLEFEVGQCCS